jgi:EmrB/QacA subfamily drug resistance transporter
MNRAGSPRLNPSRTSPPGRSLARPGTRVSVLVSRSAPASTAKRQRHARVGRTRPGLVLALVCGAQFMMILDLVVVNVALPTLQKDLHLGSSDLQWIVITYGLTFGGFLLLGGRAADLLGRRNVLVAGLSIVAAGSLGAGVAGSLMPLLGFRAMQGLGAAMTAPAALSILTGTFAEGAARNKALGIFGGVAGAGACLGSVVGGLLVGGPGWRWIFLINVPIGIALAGFAFYGLPKGGRARRGAADVLGAITVTTGLLGIVFAINKSVDYGWASPTTVGVLATGAAMLGLFVVVEQRVTSPVIPLSTFRLKTLTTANVVAVLVMGSFFGMAYLGTLFIQQVLGYSPLRAGAAALITAVTSVIVSTVVAARVVGRIGAARTLIVGQAAAATGLLYLARAPQHAGYWADIAPAYLGLGIGIGLSGVAVQIAAFTGVNDKISGLAGGMISTAQEVGAALGIAIIATAAFSASGAPGAAGGTHTAARALAQTIGFHRGALVAAGFSVAAALAAGFLLRPAERTAAPVKPLESKTDPVRRAA